MKFVKRTTAPSLDDKNWINFMYGGYNKCIVINESTGSVLPDCTGYAWGRAREAWGVEPNLCLFQAELWFTYTQDGYQRGQEPKVGSILCWRQGNNLNPYDGEGHVGFVEEVYDNGDVLMSNGWTHELFKMQTLTKESTYHFMDGFDFQGFIYPPVEFEEDKPEPPKPEPTPITDEELLDLVRKTIRGDFGVGGERVKALGENYQKVQDQVNANYEHGTATYWDDIKLY